METENKEKVEKEFLVRRDEARDLSFKGKLMASSSTQRSNNARWNEFHLYETAAGKIVFAIEEHSLYTDEEDCYYAKIYENLASFVKETEERERISYSVLKELAMQLDIDISEHID